MGGSGCCIPKTPCLCDIAAKPNFSKANFSIFIKSGCFSISFDNSPTLDLIFNFGGFLSADKANSSNSEPTISPNSINLFSTCSNNSFPQ